MPCIEGDPAEGGSLLQRMTKGLEQKAEWTFVDLFHPSSCKSSPGFPGEPPLTHSLSHVSDGVVHLASVGGVLPRPSQSTLHPLATGAQSGVFM